jgi:Predicted site-specific integrase-resolvase
VVCPPRMWPITSVSQSPHYTAGCQHQHKL